MNDLINELNEFYTVLTSISFFLLMIVGICEWDNEQKNRYVILSTKEILSQEEKQELAGIIYDRGRSSNMAITTLLLLK